MNYVSVEEYLVRKGIKRLPGIIGINYSTPLYVKNELGSHRRPVRLNVDLWPTDVPDRAGLSEIDEFVAYR